MMYFIQRINTWSPANRKCKELQEYVDQFKNCLIPDDLSRDALIEDIRHHVDTLNQAYPRTKKLAVDFNDNFLSCFPEDRQVADQYVFTFHILPVRRTYRYFEDVNLPLEGGDQ